MKKRALSFLLALVMVLSMLPLSMLSALEVSAEATTPAVTLVVNPATHHPVVSEGTYTITAEMELTTTAPFTLGSLGFSMTPAAGISIALTKAAEGETAIVLRDVENMLDETTGAPTGEKKFTYVYDKNNLKELAADTAYSLGTITLSSAAAFSIADLELEATVAAKYNSEQTEGEMYPFECKLNGYEKGDHKKAGTVWTPLSGTITEMLDSGHYYLTGDTTIGKDVFGDAFQNREITICLHGQELKGPGNGRLFRMSGGVTMTICDCTAHEEDVVDAEGNPTGEKEYVAGKITNKNADGVGHNGTQGSIFGMYVNTAKDSGNTLNLEDGILDGCGQTVGTKQGGAINIGESKAVVNINGGEIKDFAAADGGAIYVASGAKVNVTGGKIYDNEANKGGAIFIKSGTLNVSGGVIDGNTANTYGGVVFVDKDNNTVDKMINVTGGTFSNNTATNDGGVFHIPESARGTKSEVTISNATFTGNTATNGGAICGDAKLTITDTVFDGNCANNGEGGAIYIFNDELSVTGGEMKNNTAGNNGGALRIQASKATLSGGTYSGNVVHATASTNAAGTTTYSNGLGGVVCIAGTDAQLDITGGTYSENTAYHGSVVYASNATICNVTDATIQDNIGERMAAFYITGGKLNVEGTTMTGNKAKGVGGSAVYVEKNAKGGEVLLKNTTITGNTGGGGAVFVGGTGSTLTVSGKMVIKGNGNGNLHFGKGYAAGQKNLLYVNELEDSFISVSTDDTRTDANTLAQIAEGGSQSDWDTAWIQYSKNADQLALNETKTGFQWVAHSHADYEKFNPDVTWQKWGDTTAELTTLPTSGYYYLVADIAPTTEWATLNDASKNLVICLNGHTITANKRVFRLSNGGAATICDCTACGSIKDGTYTAGTIYAGISEGGVASIYTETNDAGNSSFTMYDGILDGESTERTTGVVYTGQASSTVSLLGGVIKNVTIKNADTTAARGAVTTVNCTLTVDGMLFENCVNTHTDDTKTSQEAAKGAALTFSAGNTNKVDIKNSVFKNNYAYATGSYTSGTSTLANDGYGCAIYAAGNAASVASITNCVFENNRSEMGAVSVSGTSNTNQLKLTITDCKFLSNTGTYGAAAWSYRGNPIFAGCVFDGNISTNANGSGFYGETSTRAYFSDCTFTNNKGGAALWIQASSTRAVLSGKMVFDGNANAYTGDVYFPSAINTNNNNKLHINQLTAGSKISVGSSDARTAPNVIAISSEDTDAKQPTWETSWVRYHGKAINYADDGTGTKVFSFVDATHTHGTDTLQAWEDSTKLPSTSGKYYLTRNVKLSTLVNVGENASPVAEGTEDTKKDITITLCLNGYSITAGSHRIYRLSNGANLTICDCTEHQDAAGNYVAGKLIPHATTEGGVIGMYPVGANDTSTNHTVFTMEGGIIDGAGLAGTKASMAINGAYITKSADIYSVVNLNGGEIRNCSTTGAGVVSIKGHGKLNMKDFAIRNCSSDGNGIVVVADDAILNVQDSQIIDNKAYRGSAFYDSSKESQYTNVNISGNTGTDYGALFFVGGTKVLDNVTITDNTAPYASAIYAESNAQVTLNNCDIQSNTSENTGAVFIKNGNSGLTVKGDTKITNNEGGNVTLDNISDKTVVARAFINLANVTANTKIGVGFTNFKSGSDVAAKITDGTYKAGALYADEVEDARIGLSNDITGNNDDKKLFYAEVSTGDGAIYPSLQDAVNSTNAGQGEVITLLQNADEAVTISQNVTVDLNGYDVTGAVTGTAKVQLIDSQTNDYDVADENYGIVSNIDPKVVSDYHMVGGRRYIVVKDDNGYSAHRVYVGITGTALRTSTVGIGYKVTFAADQVLQNLKTDYGMDFLVGGQITNTSMNSAKFINKYDRVVYINEFLKADKDVAYNNGRAVLTITGTPYISIAGVKYPGASRDVQFQEMFNFANAEFATLRPAQKKGIHGLYTTFNDEMIVAGAGWQYTNVAGYNAQ